MADPLLSCGLGQLVEPLLPARWREWGRREFDVDLLRATQLVRCRQSPRSLPMVLGASTVFLWVLWPEAPKPGLVAWTALVILSLGVRVAVCRRIHPAIATGDARRLLSVERLLALTSLSNNLCMGSAFWFVCLHGSHLTHLPITLVCAIYSIGAMVNASVQYASFAPTVIANLGQGVLFFSGIGAAVQPAPIVSLLTVIGLLLTFGRENARAFSESIAIRQENVALVAELEREKGAAETALRSAERANEAKTRFLAAASHDLRQPLHAMSLFLGTLSLQVRDTPAERLVVRLGEIAEILGRQFNGMLDLARFDAGRVEPERTVFRLDRLVSRLGEQHREAAARKGLAFEADCPPLAVTSDYGLLERVLGNLLGNAVRYTNEGRVAIGAHAEGCRVRLTVEDTGPGIPEESQARVFEDFVQLGNPGRRREHGVGLGLAIVHRIDVLLGLGLQMASRPGAGTRFQLELEAAELPEEAVPVHDPGLVGPDVHGARVWVLEDDEVVAEALRAQFEAWGCEVWLGNSRAAFERALAEKVDRPDTVFIDDMLGEGEWGLEIAQWVSRRIGRQRIAMVTGNVDPERLEEIGAAGFPLLLKPVPSARLREMIAGTLHAGAGVERA